MASRDTHPRTIVPTAGAKKTRPTHIVPGSLHLFTHPAQRVTAPVRAHFARRYNRPEPFGAALFLFDALAAALVLALAVTLGSFILAPGAAAPLRLTVAASDAQVRAADTIGFVVSYENRGKLPLENASLALSLPDGFRTTSLEANSAMNTVIEPLTAHGVIPLGTVGPGGNGTVRVAGYMLQPADAVSDLRLTATLTGTQKDGQTMQSVSEAVVRVAGSALALRWAGAPDHMPAIDDGNLVRRLLIMNGGSTKIGGLQIQVIDAEGKLDQRPIEINGGETLVVDEYAQTTAVSVPLSAWLTEEPEADARRALASADSGDDWTDRGPRVSSVAAEIGGDGIDVHARVASTGPDLDRGEWRLFPQPWSAVDAARFPADAEAEGIAAGSFRVANGTPADIAFRIPLKPGVDASALTVRAVVTACAVSAGPCAWSSSPRVAVRSAAPTLVAELRYYTEEGEQLGRGPLPPRVAEKTEYWVVVRAEPGLITRDTELRVELGDHVIYADKFSASISGAPRQVGNALVWRPDALADGGAFTFAAALAFRPIADMVDAEAVIVRSVRLLGKDASGAPMEAVTGYLATDVPADARAAEKGTRVRGALE